MKNKTEKLSKETMMEVWKIMKLIKIAYDEFDKNNLKKDSKILKEGFNELKELLNENK